jgi:hypothetical protein
MQKKERKGAQIGKEEIKLSLFADDDPILKDPKNSAKNSDLINTFSKVAAYKINVQKLVAFLHANNKHIKKEIRKTIPFTIPLKNI